VREGGGASYGCIRHRRNPALCTSHAPCRPLAIAAIRRQLDAAERAFAARAAQQTDELLEQQKKLNENRAQLSAQVC
jgi:hypothetical protein